MIRYAVIGTNFITDQFIEAAEEYNNIKLVAVYSRNIQKAQEYAKQHGAKLIFDNLLELAKCDEIDLVYIASPNSLHYSQSILMLQHKKHVLCEKPIASNSDELEEMLKIASENEVILLEAMRPVFDPGLHEIVKNLPKLGIIRRATFQYSKYSSRYDKFKQGIIENAFNPDLSNGSLMDIGVYCVHALVRLFGLPKDIKSYGILLSNGIDGSGTILANYDGMQAELIHSKIANSYLPSEIQGEEATMVIDEIYGPNSLILYYKDGTKETISIEKKENNMFYEIEEMVRLVENSESPEFYNQYSVMELKLMDEVRKQMRIVFPADRKYE